MLAERFGDNAHFIRADVTVEDDIQRLINGTAERFGKLDVLFNNAGSGALGNIEDVTTGQIDFGVRLLYSSVLLGTKYAVPHMKANGGGAIINNSSISAIRYGQSSILYASIKAAVTFYSELAGVELGSHGIRVNTISSGAIATPIFWRGTEKADTLSEAENTQKLEKTISDMANVVLLKPPGLACGSLEQAGLRLLGKHRTGEAGRLPWLRPVMSGTASRHSGFACLFTISTPFSHSAPTRRQRPHLLAAGVAIATGYRG